MPLKHLDIFDPRRYERFAQARCRDCEHFLRGAGCGAEAELARRVRQDLAECAPDTLVPGLRIAPTGNEAANRCPCLWPSYEYLEELRQDHAAQDADDHACAARHALARSHKGYAA